jgi:hypothetical protein
MCQTCITTKKCVHCDADLALSKHSLAAMYVEALFKLRAAVRHYDRNSIHIRHEMYAAKGSPFQLTTDQWSNFGKLRYFGLAHHAGKENPKSGKWLLTDRGGAFLRGDIAIPRKVFTFRGHPVDSPEPVKPVHILEYRKELPSFETYYDFKPAQSRLPKTAQLFGHAIQGPRS